MYEKSIETRILRVKHKVTFRIGTTMADLLSSLKEVPGHAVVDEVLADDDAALSILFHEESAV